MLKGLAKLKKCLIAALIIGVCLMAVGCGAEVNYYVFSDDNYNYITFELRMDNVYKAAMEHSATYVGSSGEKWTLEKYLKEFVKFTPQFIYDDTVVGDSATLYSLTSKTRKRVSADNNNADIKTNPFFHTVTVKEDNPFNGLRQDYDSASGYQSVSLMQRVKNGIGEIGVDGAYKQYVPSILQAFPMLKSQNPDDLKLNFLWSPGTTRMRTSAIGSTEIDGKTFYCFSRNFDVEKEMVEYQYFRPNSIGWNITAIVLGGLTVLIIYLVTRKKKDKGLSLTERFPYNPEEHTDIYGGLPVKRQ